MRENLLTICAWLRAHVRRRRIAIAFIVLAAVCSWGAWKIETQQGQVKHLAASARSLAEQNRAGQERLKREIAARRKEREAQIAAIDAAIKAGCSGQHKIAEAVGSVLTRALGQTTEKSAAKQLELLLGHPLTPEQLEAVKEAVRTQRKELADDLALVHAADCPVPAVTTTTTTTTA